MISAFCIWLAQTPLSEWIQTTTWIIPLVQTVHILCVAVIMASALMLDLRLLGLIDRGAAIAALEHRFLPPVWLALVVLLLTGTVLTIGEPRRELMNSVFRLKMVLVIAAACLTWLLQRRTRGSSGVWEINAANRIQVRLLAFSSLALWLAILTAGRWIAYSVES